ncbi:MAG: alanine--tRNA ligase, partial [Gammaproteobacteria bacterium HGW-Gammaproteobacteria-2]
LRVIADHIRACSFLIVDGVLPSNEGRGYVLRRIIRRAIRHIWKLGALRSDGLFWRMVEPLCAVMGEAYPELLAKRALVEQALRAEEAAFAQTLEAGMNRLDAHLKQHGGVDGEALFQLHDTYGCPPDLILDILRERGQVVDPAQMLAYDALMTQQRERARAASKFAGSAGLPGELLSALPATQFGGYETLAAEACTVLALVVDGRSVQRIAAADQAIVVLDKTPFYAESGGQVGDTGILTGSSGQRFTVSDTHKFANQFHGHIGSLESGALAVGDSVAAAVDGERRQAIVINHSATHLLHAALREVLGEHVSQKGSLVAPDRLRFDFSHFQPVSGEQLTQIETLVNAQIRGNAEAEVQQMDMQQALDSGAMALFGEKYGERVRVLRMGAFSTELCGGTHVRHTGDIGLFKILSEGGVAAGVRRIEAVTGAAALAHVANEEQRLAQIATLLGGGQSEVLDKLQQLLQRQAANAREIGDVRVVAARLEGIDGKTLREAVDQLKDRLGNAVIVLAGASDGRASLVAGVSGTALGRIKAGELVAHIASQIGGKGGGRPDMAQGGGDDGAMLQSALAGVEAWLAQRL